MNKPITQFNRIMYGLFIALAFYQSLANHDYVDSASSLGIALIFDPFNSAQPWNERPTWQKIWLFIHLACVALLFGLGVALANK